DKFERRKCCSSGTAAAVFALGATPQRLERPEPILFRVAALHMIPRGSQLTHSATWSGRCQQARATDWRVRPWLNPITRYHVDLWSVLHRQKHRAKPSSKSRRRQERTDPRHSS